MMISTKGRYALRVLADLANQPPGVYVPLKDIAARQEISQKYLESIMATLSKNGLVDALHGKGGGYKLNREPSCYRVSEILRVTESSMAPVACLQEGAAPCARAKGCKTLPMWKHLSDMLENFFSGITLKDIRDGNFDMPGE